MEEQNGEQQASEIKSVVNKQNLSLRDKRQASVLNVVLIVLVLILIGISGFLGYENVKLQKEISAIKVVSSPSAVATIDPTANWKTYTSQDGTFSLKYPSSWYSGSDFAVSSDPISRNSSLEVIISPIAIGTVTKQSYEMLITVYSNPQSLSTKDYLRQIINNDKAQNVPTDQFNNQEDVNLAGIQAIKLSRVFSADKNLEEIYVASGNKVVFISYPTAEANDNLFDPINNYQIVKQILSTFQFTTPTSQTDTSNWKTYTGTNFTFKYPGNYNIQTTPGNDIYSLSNFIIQLKSTLASGDQYGIDNNFTVSSDSNVQNCPNVFENAETTALSNEQVDGVNFHKWSVGGAGSGNSYSGIIYQVMKLGVCYQIDLVFHTSTGAVAAPTDIFNKSVSQSGSELSQILSTFQFTN